MMRTMQSSVMLFNTQVDRKGQISEDTMGKMFAKFYGRDMNIVEEL